MLDVDSPNLYAFVAWRPQSSADPLGLYEEDVHRHLTVYLAMKAGFDRSTAEKIGDATEALDLDARDAMYGGGANNVNMELYHFVSPQRLLQMRKEALSGGQLDDDRLRSIGEFLHAWEDSYSHQADPKRRDFRQQYHDVHPVPFNNQDIGHGRHKHEPDWTWKRAELAITMAETTFHQLVALCEEHKDECSGKPIDFESFQGKVEEFSKETPELYADLYAGMITVPDVVSYEEKVQILDSSFTTKGTQEAANRERRVDAAKERERQEEKERQEAIRRNADKH